MALDVYFPEDIKAIGDELIFAVQQQEERSQFTSGFVAGVQSLMRALKADIESGATHVVIEGQYKMYNKPNRKAVE